MTTINFDAIRYELELLNTEYALLNEYDKQQQRTRKRRSGKRNLK